MLLSRFKINSSLLIIVGIWLLFFIKILSGSSFLADDIIEQEFPHRIFTRDSFLSGQFPHWNPYTFGGMPFFSALQAGVLYVPNVILSFLPLNQNGMWYALHLFIALHILFGGIGMFLFTRYHFRLQPQKAPQPILIAAAVSFMFSGFFITHMIHSMMLGILVWVPWIFLLLEKGFREKRWHFVAIASLVQGLTIFSGHPQMSFYQFLFLGWFMAYLLTKYRKWNFSGIGMGLSFFVLAVTIAAIQLLPAIEMIPEVSRADWTFEQASEGSLSYGQLWSLLIPKLFGTRVFSPEDGVSFWLKLPIPPFGSEPPVTGYWTFWETCFYSGALVLLIGLAQFSQIKKSLFLKFCAGWMIFTFLVALGPYAPLYKVLYNYVPGFGFFRMPARILFSWNLLLPLLMVQLLLHLRPRFNYRGYYPLYVLGSIAIAGGIFFISGAGSSLWPQMQTDPIQQFAAKQSTIMLLLVIGAAIAFSLYFTNKISQQRLFYAILILITFDMFSFGFGLHLQNRQSGPERFQQYAQVSSFLKKQAKELPPHRVMIRNLENPGYMIQGRNQGMIDKVQYLAGYNPLNLARRLPPTALDKTLQIMNVRFGLLPDASGQLRLLPIAAALPRAALYYTYHTFSDDSAAAQFMRSESFDPQQSVVLHQDALGAVDFKSRPLGVSNASVQSSQTPEARNNEEKVTIDSYSQNAMELTVQTPEPAILFLSEVYYPAFKATVNGKSKQILRANMALRAVVVPSGTSTVRVAYHSPYFTWGLILSLVSLGAVMVWILIGRKITAKERAV